MAKKIPPRRVPRDRFVQRGGTSGSLFGGRSIPGAHTHVEADITDLDKYTQAAADAKFVEVGGDTMTGLLLLSAVPVADLGAATKKFVDDHNWLEADITDLDKYTVAGADAAFAPISHTHLEADITDLQAYLLDITAEALGTLSDVTITAIASGELLKWTGTAFINNTLAEAGISATGHNHDHGALTGLGDDDHSQYHTDARGDARYSLLAHTHLEADITDLQAYLLDITAEALGTLSDVTITAIASGELLKWTGTAFINNTLAEAGISATGHTHVVANITDFDPTDYLLLAGGTLVGTLTAQNVYVADDSSQVRVGAGGDGRFYHQGTHTYLYNKTGQLRIYVANNGGIGTDITFYTQDTLRGTIAATGAMNWLTDFDVSAGTLKQGGVGVSVIGHTHTESDITDLKAYLELAGGTMTGNLDMAGGGDVTFWDSTNTDYVRLEHNSLDFRIVTSSTTRHVEITSGGTGALLVKLPLGIRLLNNVPLEAAGFVSGQVHLVKLDASDVGQFMSDGDAAAFGGALNVVGALSEGGTQVSLVGHTHVEADITDLVAYLPLAGGTLTGDLDVEADIDIFDGKRLIIRDAGNTDHAIFSHDGTHFKTVMTNTDRWSVTGMTGQFQFDSIGGMRLLNLAPYRSVNAAASGSIEMMKLDGSDVGRFMPNGQAAKFGGALDVVGALTENTTQVSLVGHTHVEADITDLVAYLPLAGGTLSGLLSANSGVYVKSGSGLRVYDASNADYSQWKHDGTDFNNILTNTADYNITGYSDFMKLDENLMVNAADNAFVYALPGLNGIIVRTTPVAGVVTGLWIQGNPNGGDWDRGIALQFGNWQTTNKEYTSRIIHWGKTSATRASRLSFETHTGTQDVWFENCMMFADRTHFNGQLRVMDDGATDYGQWSHDGTDFNLVLVNTTDYNITGITNLNVHGTTVSLEGHTHSHATLTNLLADDHTQYLLKIGGTMSGNLVITTADPRLRYIETGAAVDNGTWEVFVNNEEYRIRLLNDSRSTGVNVFTLSRTLNVANTANWIVNNLQHNGTDVSLVGHTHVVANITDFDPTDYLLLAGGTVTGAVTLTGAAPGLQIAHTRAQIQWNQTDASADNKGWSIRADDEQFTFKMHNDAFSNSSSWLTVDRTGFSTADKVNFTAVLLQQNGVNVALAKMTTNGDILYYNSGRQRLAKGTDDQVLTLASGIPSWADAAGGGGIAVTVSTAAPSGSASDGDLWCRV